MGFAPSKGRGRVWSHAPLTHTHTHTHTTALLMTLYFFFGEHSFCFPVQQTVPELALEQDFVPGPGDPVMPQM